MSEEKKTKRKPDDASMMLKVIFLDIDGVLLPFPQKECPKNNTLFPANTMKALDRLLKATEARLILSSTWRSQDQFVNDILEDFEQHNMDVNLFCGMTDKHYHAERQWEIHQWLTQQDKDKEICWLALDDEELIEGEKNEKLASVFQGHVIKTESSIGLTEDDVDRGIRLWRKQLE